MRQVTALIEKIEVKKAQIKKLRTRKAGRHEAPSQFGKISMRAGAIALATTAVTGIVTVSLASGFASAAPTASIKQAEYQSRLAESRSAQSQSARSQSARSQSARSQSARKTSAWRMAQRRVARRGDAKKTSGAASSKSWPAAAHPKTADKASLAALNCTGTSGMLPANFAAIVTFLTTHGYTPMAAAGIAGNIYQESMGNPESVGTGGGGLIGWTPLPAGFVTGNPAADLRTQLEAVLTYNRQWAQYIPALNAATSPTQAADIYMNYFERPGIPAAYNREAAAAAVASACGF